uniref:Uncharacterized protein n=1 Tax=Avena sativa TaxID=4498 RepID=A0ACD5ZJ16_AVESA
MGEDEQQVEKQPNGYMFRKNSEAVQGAAGLVTLDRVWQLDDDMLLLMAIMPQLKDLCLKFALFKLLRCRFARYKLADDRKMTAKFVRSALLKDGENKEERAFRIIADELSFLHDYYDSPLPISYSDNQLTMLSMVISVLTIGYCILSGVDVIRLADYILRFGNASTTFCTYDCVNDSIFDQVPVVLLFVLVVVAEARDVASHICSSWTKVILTCRCAQRASLRLSPVVPKWVGCLLQCRCNRLLMRHWNDKMRHNSLLTLHPRPLFHKLVFPGCLLRLLNQNVKVPAAVKVCIIATLRRSTSSSRSSGDGLSKGITSLRRTQNGETLLWACSSKGTSDTILVWHIATTTLEVRYPHHRQDGRPSSTSDDQRTAGTHLSRYCAYLVEFCPELLPDDDAWSKSLYKDVKKDAERALAIGGGTAVSSMPPEAGYRRLIELLGMRQNHEVLKDAAKLAEQLGELATGGEEIAWKLLAGFWAEMVLYLAPSDILKGHMEAVDRGGELITLLWTLLTHVGIVDRPESAAAAGPSSS